MARVLVVDDEEILLKAFVRALRRGGHAVEATSTALAALEHVRNDPPELLILDYRLPDMDGLRLHREALELLGDGFRPVLFVSGSPIEELTAKMPLPDGADFLQKPFDLSELLRKVGALLAEGERRRRRLCELLPGPSALADR